MESEEEVASEEDEECCSVSSNMGWRYLVIVIGSMTLFIFFARYFLFTFHESPKYLISKGRDQEAIDVLHKIAKFNKSPPPTINVEHFRNLDREMGVDSDAPAVNNDAKGVVLRAVKEMSYLKGLFTRKLPCFIFVLLGLTFMVCYFRLPAKTPTLLGCHRSLITRTG